MDAESRAADTLLERGIGIRLPMPLFLRLFKKTFRLKVYQPKLGTLLRISSLYLTMEIDEDKLDDLRMGQILRMQKDKGKIIAKIVACAILNGKWSYRIFGKILTNYLAWGLSFNILCKLVNIIILTGGTEDFTNTIRLTSHLRMTTPILSQAT